MAAKERILNYYGWVDERAGTVTDIPSNVRWSLHCRNADLPCGISNPQGTCVGCDRLEAQKKGTQSGELPETHIRAWDVRLFAAGSASLKCFLARNYYAEVDDEYTLAS